MSALVVVGSLALIGVVLWDAFEAMLLPRRITHGFRLARLYYRATWVAWAALARRLRPGKRREAYLSVFGPLSMLGLFAAWAAGVILGFALLQWSLGSPLNTPHGRAALRDYLYLSGVTFFTLGYGDVAPTEGLGRALAVAEAGLGFGLLAVVLSYLPVLYQAFSRREATIALLDARAGSPPTAGQLLLRLAPARGRGVLEEYLSEWERWAIEVLESHVSFPALSYYRSQHDNQSWLATLTLILDVSSLIIAGLKGNHAYRARLAFAAARHAAVDLALVLRAPPHRPDPDRLPAERLGRLRAELDAAGLPVRPDEAATAKLAELRGLYEPFLAGLGERLLLRLPPFLPEGPAVDNWQTSAWMRRTGGLGELAAATAEDDHDD